MGSSAGLFYFLMTHDLNRHEKGHGIDWSDGSAFHTLLIIYIFIAISTSILQAYLVWLCSTFSNQPSVLSRYSGYVEALKGAGLISAFAVDSQSTPFLNEAAIYYSLAIAGTILCLLSALVYTQDTKYGEEESVIVPKAFEVDQEAFAKVTETTKVEISAVEN